MDGNMNLSGSFKLEGIGNLPLGESFQKVLNEIVLGSGDSLKDNYFASCGCDDHSECNCVGYGDCKSNDCSCNTYDFMEDDCAKFNCSIMCEHGIWGV